MNLDEFLAKVATECVTSGVALVLSPGNRVFYGGMACNGFFESLYPVETGLAAVSTGNWEPRGDDQGRMGPLLAAAQGGKTPEEFLSLLAHEYCHMRQFLEGSPLWMDSTEFNTWEGWLAGEEVEEARLRGVWKRIVQLEADCETRVLALAEQLDLALDRQLYAQRANAYVFFYSWALKNRSFYRTAPYEIPDIVAQMPTRMLPLEDYVGERAVTLLTLFDRCR